MRQHAGTAAYRRTRVLLFIVLQALRAPMSCHTSTWTQTPASLLWRSRPSMMQPLARLVMAWHWCWHSVAQSHWSCQTSRATLMQCPSKVPVQYRVLLQYLWSADHSCQLAQQLFNALLLYTQLPLSHTAATQYEMSDNLCCTFDPSAQCLC